MPNSVQEVNDTVRLEFEYNVRHVEQFLTGRGYDFGCGSCPLLRINCLHVDISDQPLAKEQVGARNVMKADASAFDFLYWLKNNTKPVDYIFSSHMLEDLPDKKTMIYVLNMWEALLNPGGYIVLLLPDMQGGRYPTVEEGGNCSHRVNVGVQFINEISSELMELSLVQLDTIPHDKSCTLDVVFKKEG